LAYSQANGVRRAQAFTGRREPGQRVGTRLQLGGTLWVSDNETHLSTLDNEDDQPGVGNGFVDIFNPDGTRVKRFVSNGRLNSPWAVVAAPSDFGSAGGDILIGNFGDGQIGADDATTGAFRGLLHDSNNVPLTIDGR
jgi:uncharacterized protein (TIGR03118 family)